LPKRVDGLLRLDEIRRDFQRLLVGIERFGDMPGLRQCAAELEISLSCGL